MGVREVNSFVEQSRLMGQFLDYCNAPRQFHLARQLDAAGPIKEIPRLLKKCSDDDERDDVLNCIFANMVVEPKGDITRYVRRFKSILESPAAPEFIRKEVDLAAEVADRLSALPAVSSAAIRDEIRGDDKLVQRFIDTMDAADLEAKRSKLLSAPAESILNAAHILEGIDSGLFSRLPAHEREEALKGLRDVEAAVESIRQAIEAVEAYKDGDEA